MRLITIYISLNIEFQNLLFCKISLKVIIYMNRPNPNGGSCKYNVTSLKCKELTDETDQPIYTMYHIASKTSLYCFPVYIQMKVNILHIANRLQR